MRRIAIALTLTMVGALALGGQAYAQTQPPVAPPPVSPPAPAEVATPEATVQALYAVISGPAGSRDWPKLRGLMAPGAEFLVAGKREGAIKLRRLGVEDYVQAAGKAMAGEGFYEHGVIWKTVRYAHTAVVSSPYESRHAPGEKPFARGINQFELMFDGTRWWVVSIYWEGETADFPLPAEADVALKNK